LLSFSGSGLAQARIIHGAIDRDEASRSRLSLGDRSAKAA